MGPRGCDVALRATRRLRGADVTYLYLSVQDTWPTTVRRIGWNADHCALMKWKRGLPITISARVENQEV